MKLIKMQIGHVSIDALADTGSSHCLITVDAFNKLENVQFEGVSMIMKVAGSSLKDNIVGKTTLQFELMDDKENLVRFTQEFLIAHNLNNYSSILGADFLLNPSITCAIMPDSLLVTVEGDYYSIPIFSKPVTKNRSHLLTTVSTELLSG